MLTSAQIFLQDFLGHLPGFIRALILEHMPSSKLEQARATVRLGTRVAKDLVKLKAEALLTGDSKGVKDIMTLLRESRFVFRGWLFVNARLNFCSLSVESNPMHPGMKRRG